MYSQWKKKRAATALGDNRRFWVQGKGRRILFLAPSQGKGGERVSARLFWRAGTPDFRFLPKLANIKRGLTRQAGGMFSDLDTEKKPSKGQVPGNLQPRVRKDGLKIEGGCNSYRQGRAPE